MSFNELQIGDIGTSIIIEILDQDGGIVDISEYNTYSIILSKPNGASLSKTATLQTDGKDGIVKFVSTGGDFDVAGIYKIQAVIESSSKHHSSDIYSFRVLKNII